MKIQILQEDLSKTLITALRFTSTRSTLPILGSFLLKAEKTKLIVSATNLEMSITTQIGAKVEEEGEILVPSKNFTEIVSNLGLGQIELTSVKEELKINANNFTGNIVVAPSNDFPKVPSEIANSFVLTTKELNNSLTKVLWATSLDETRPVLGGVLFIFQENKLTFVSSDGFRLSKKEIALKNSPNLPTGKQIILPRTSLLELQKLAANTESIDLELKETDNQLVIKTGESYLTTRLIDGNFPEFGKIIPTTFSTTVNIDKNDLHKATKLASVFAKENGNLVKLIISENNLTITSEGAKVGSQKAVLEAKVEGSQLEILFNYKFVEDFLNSVVGDSVEIKFVDSISPSMWLDPKDENFFHIIMPVRIQN